MARKHDYFKPNVPPPHVDLHCHSTASDGTLTPTELVRVAAGLRLQLLGLTDHDSVGGLSEFLQADAPPSLRRLGGVEISCADGTRRLHLIGLGIRTEDPALLAMLAEVREWRQQRNREMATRLVDLGLPVATEDFSRLLAEVEVLGRPHLAALLVERGVCRTMRDAFSRFLGHGRPGYVPRRVSPLDEAIRVIHGAGGAAIWGHPLTAGSLSVAKFQRLACDYAERGMDGMEAYYPEFTPHQVRTVVQAAEKAGMLLSGGSDFHGEHIPDIALGTGYGSLHVPVTVVQPLLERIASRGGIVPAMS